ncbi:MAG: L-2-amino-thiazoline-4-carboxylic acid hydrolase [Chlorobiaceae bacterium]|nr:L-2-amino-thiazoline-4-carboxylic acid hydrolase [Chlorobiaceae bacterium]
MLELGVLAPLYSELVGAVGREVAGKIMSRTVSGIARKAGSEWGRHYPAGDLEGIRSLWKKLAEGGALEVDLKKIENGLEVTVRRCDYAAMYIESGLEELGVILSCSRDEPFAEGYSGRIRFKRKKGILEGDECCVMTYEYENTP